MRVFAVSLAVCALAGTPLSALPVQSFGLTVGRFGQFPATRPQSWDRLPLAAAAGNGPAMTPDDDLPARIVAAQCANILAFGGDRTGVNDNSAAFTSAEAAGNGCVRLPAGVYRFSTSPRISLGAKAMAAATIIGEGADVTVLRFDSGISGPVITLGENDQSFHIRDLSIVSAGTSRSTIGLSVALSTSSGSTPTQSDVAGVTIRGSDGYAKTNAFGTLFSLSSVSNVTFINDNFIGSAGGAAFATSSGPTCIRLVGTSQSIPVQLNFVAIQANYCSAGIDYGNYVQGVAVTASNFVGNLYGIRVGKGQVGNDQLAVSASQFNNGVADIGVESLIDGVTITGNDFYSITNGGAGIVLDQIDSYAIVGNTFIGINGMGQNALVIGGGLGGTVTGNQFKGSGFGTCILLNEGSAGANVQSNSYFGSCVHVKNLGGSRNTVGGGSP